MATPQRSQRGQGRKPIVGPAPAPAAPPPAPAPAPSPNVPAQSPSVYNQTTTSNIQDEIARRATSALGGFQSSVNGMDLGGQFAPGAAPSQQQVFQQSAAQVPNAGAAGFTAVPQRAQPQIAAVAAPTMPAGIMPAPLSAQPGQAPSKVETAADQAQAALGGAPRVDMGIADRRLGEYQEALGMSREVIDRLLNGPNTAARLGEQTLRSQLALARSARGGPGAVQQALSAAQQQAPELQAQAAASATAEDIAKTTAAGNVASNFAQAALGARGQDVNIAGKNVDSGLAVKDMVTRLAGVQLELDQRNTELIGQMARDLAALQFDWASLDEKTASAALDRYLQIYQIDQNYAAQIKAIAAQGKITPKDILNGIVGVVGAAAGVGAAAVGGK